MNFIDVLLLTIFLALPFSAVAVGITQVLVHKGNIYSTLDTSIFHCIAASSKGYFEYLDHLYFSFSVCVCVCVFRNHCTISTIWFPA